MGIGTSIFLIALGAILSFALNVTIGGLDLDVVGWILMAAGVLGLIMTMVIWNNRRRSVVTTAEPTEYRQVTTTEPTEYRRVEERRDVLPPR
ncbi:hypothetical protein GCM10022225_36130 [Plantactinospora mayteni]|uniref:DUF6458 domain-containing protein n=1 Tax=Plantactinospora mayteni TaxID=566021 RepID=A0ABQ4EMB9_9ACTN|nr:DUF6458 family protein [Plantactinospora mayteni]GIG95776.1 hypothetical protein Pma05_23490 [Plantactinospora mayteni]